jgi:uncharacterized protein with PIN domain
MNEQLSRLAKALRLSGIDEISTYRDMDKLLRFETGIGPSSRAVT